MTKNEFITRLTSELYKRNVADSADIIEEYAQHFAFKTADGYSEEEIAARLGIPEELAAQFGESETAVGKTQHSKVLTLLWLVWADLFFGIFAALLLAFGAVLAACVLSFGLTGVCLIGNLGNLPIVTLLPMPYWCGAVLGFSLLALCVLSVAGCIWYFAFCRQMFRSYGRFHRNALASAAGKAVLPPLTVNPQFSGKAKRKLRQTALISLALFAVCFVLSFAVCALSAGNIEFWHAWGWFGYTA